jgi:hypothetical protein
MVLRKFYSITTTSTLLADAVFWGRFLGCGENGLTWFVCQFYQPWMIDNECEGISEIIGCEAEVLEENLP